MMRRLNAFLCFLGFHSLKDDGLDLVGRERLRCRHCAYREVTR
jgi:hypothetical protein